MAVATDPIRLPTNLKLPEDLVRILRLMANRIDSPRIESVAQYTGGVSNPPTQAEVTAIAAKLNELIAALVNAVLMEEP